MSRVPFLRLCALLATLSFVAGSVALSAQGDNSRRGRKYKAPPPSSTIEVTILKADNGKPISDAHVIFHPIEGDKDKGYLELKTNEDGKAVITVLPIGDTVRLQVIADGYQTYGSDYQVDRPNLAWEICLRRPSAQYSIYTNHPTSLGATSCPDNISHQNSGKISGSVDSGKSASSSQNAAPPAAGGKPSGASGQSDAQPNQAQSKPQPN